MRWSDALGGPGLEMKSKLRFSAYLRALAFVAGVAALIAVLAAACGSSDPEEVEISVSLRDKLMTPETVRVSQHDTVALKVDSDAPGSLHLHGYDIEQTVTPGTVADFIFVADATGRYRMAFHPAASGGHGQGGSDAGGGHDVVEAETPVSISVMAEQDDAGGVYVRIATEGWRWAPEEVNMANTPGAGHAHVYVDGVKINRVYGPDYYLTGVEPGMREIRVSLNTNGHNELMYGGEPLEGTTMVEVAAGGMPSLADLPAVDAEAAMTVEVMAHPDPLGGYNLQVMPTGFEFTPQHAGGDHVSGEGFGYVLIDGEFHARLYSPWLKLPGLEQGMHEITVSLASNQGNPYRWEGSPVEASAMVHEGAEEQPAGSHDHGGAEDGNGASAETAAAEAEYDVGYLEVLPR